MWKKNSDGVPNQGASPKGAPLGPTLISGGESTGTVQLLLAYGTYEFTATLDGTYSSATETVEVYSTSVTLSLSISIEGDDVSITLIPLEAGLQLIHIQRPYLKDQLPLTQQTLLMSLITLTMAQVSLTNRQIQVVRGDRQTH